MMFGYYGNGFRGFGYDALAVEATTQTLAWLETASTEEMLAQLRRVRLLGQRAIIFVGPMIFATYPSSASSAAVPEFDAWWLTLAECHDVVAGVLIFDEPWRANENHFHLPADEVSASIQRAATELRRLLPPSVAIVLAASGAEFSKYAIPQACDWLGVYAYSYNTHWSLLIFYVWNLLRRKGRHQRLIAIADAYEKAGVVPNQSRIKTHNGWWRTLVGRYPGEFVAVAPFLFQSGPMGTGADGMAMVRIELAQWAIELRAAA